MGTCSTSTTTISQRWLSLQEFYFNIECCKGALNTNADALSHCHEEGTRQQNVTATLINSGEADLHKAQQQDQHVAKIYDQLVSSSNQPSDKVWKQQSLKHYKQIWPQLLLVKGCVCRRYCPNPMSDLCNHSATLAWDLDCPTVLIMNPVQNIRVLIKH